MSQHMIVMIVTYVYIVYKLIYQLYQIVGHCSVLYDRFTAYIYVAIICRRKNPDVGLIDLDMCTYISEIT